MAVRPPKLTRQEFLRKKPVNPVAGRSGGQRYQSYLTAYQNKYKPVTQQAPQNPVPTLQSMLARLGQFETPAQLEARANRMANQGVKSQQTIIREEAKLMRDEAQQRAEAMAAAGRAAASMNAGLFGMVGGEYNAGAQEIRNLGTSGANQIQDTTAANVLRQNAGLEQVGAPDVRVGGDVGDTTVAGAPQAHVEAYRGGELPGQAIANAGQAATFGLSGMVAAQNLRATQEANAGFRDAVASADKARMAALKELAAGRPAQAAQFLQQLQDAQRQQIGLASGLIQQRAAMRQAGFEQGMTKKEFAEKKKQQAYQNAQTAKQQAFQNAITLQEMGMKETAMGVDLGAVDPTKSMALGYVVNKNGKPILKNGKKIPWKALLRGTKSSSTTRSMTPGQRADLLGKAQQVAEGSLYGWITDEDGNRVPANYAPDFDPKNPKYGQGDLQYPDAINRLTAMGLSRSDAMGVLDTYYERGDMRRPIFSLAEMKFYKKKVGPRKFQWAYGQIQDLLNRGQADAADDIINEILYNGGSNLKWVGPK